LEGGRQSQTFSEKVSRMGGAAGAEFLLSCYMKRLKKNEEEEGSLGLPIVFNLRLQPDPNR
jgi:hypothetical protein